MEHTNNTKESLSSPLKENAAFCQLRPIIYQCIGQQLFFWQKKKWNGYLLLLLKDHCEGREEFELQLVWLSEKVSENSRLYIFFRRQAYPNQVHRLKVAKPKIFRPRSKAV